MGEAKETVEKNNAEEPTTRCEPRIVELKATINKVLDIFYPEAIRDTVTEETIKAMKASLDVDSEEILTKKLQTLVGVIREEAAEMEAIITTKLMTGGAHDGTGSEVPGGKSPT